MSSSSSVSEESETMKENSWQTFDELARDKNDAEWAQAQFELVQPSLCRRLEELVAYEFNFPKGSTTYIPPMIIGRYNNLYRIQVEDMSPDVMIRRPSVSQSQLPAEKTLAEAATARFIYQKTKIPTAQVWCYKPASDVGPFMVIDRVENECTLARRLTRHGHGLDPRVTQNRLENLYLETARIVLELSRHEFPRIGSLLEADDGIFSIAGRPLTQNINDMLQRANIPLSILPPAEKTFATATEYYKNLARNHLVQLVFQHNDVVSTVHDCKNKYVARQLFHQLAQEGYLSTFGFAEDDWSAQANSSPFKNSQLLSAPADTSAFRLYGDDFRPRNMLVNGDDNEIVAVIDWEFTYAAPTQFSLDPPWWLLLDTPEMWDAGIDDWVLNFEKRLPTWLDAMQKAEEKNPYPFGSTGEGELNLEVYMRQSWETGRFWLSYAARKSWAFDTIFWKFLDERFFGERVLDGKGDGSSLGRRDIWKTRVHLLSEEARYAMEPFVERKMEERRVRMLVEWEANAARERLGEVFFE